MIAAVDCVNADCGSDSAHAENFTDDGWVIGVVFTCDACATQWLELNRDTLRDSAA